MELLEGDLSSSYSSSSSVGERCSFFAFIMKERIESGEVIELDLNPSSY